MINQIENQPSTNPYELSYHLSSQNKRAQYNHANASRKMELLHRNMCKQFEPYQQFFMEQAWSYICRPVPQFVSNNKYHTRNRFFMERQMMHLHAIVKESNFENPTKMLIKQQNETAKIIRNKGNTSAIHQGKFYFTNHYQLRCIHLEPCFQTIIIDQKQCLQVNSISKSDLVLAVNQQIYELKILKEEDILLLRLFSKIVLMKLGEDNGRQRRQAEFGNGQYSSNKCVKIEFQMQILSASVCCYNNRSMYILGYDNSSSQETTIIYKYNYEHYDAVFDSDPTQKGFQQCYGVSKDRLLQDQEVLTVVVKSNQHVVHSCWSMSQQQLLLITYQDIFSYNSRLNKYTPIWSIKPLNHNDPAWYGCRIYSGIPLHGEYHSNRYFAITTSLHVIIFDITNTQHPLLKAIPHMHQESPPTILQFHDHLPKQNHIPTSNQSNLPHHSQNTIETEDLTFKKMLYSILQKNTASNREDNSSPVHLKSNQSVLNKKAVNPLKKSQRFQTIQNMKQCPILIAHSAQQLSSSIFTQLNFQEMHAQQNQTFHQSQSPPFTKSNKKFAFTKIKSSEFFPSRKGFNQFQLLFDSGKISSNLHPKSISLVTYQNFGIGFLHVDCANGIAVQFYSENQPTKQHHLLQQTIQKKHKNSKINQKKQYTNYFSLERIHLVFNPTHQPFDNTSESSHNKVIHSNLEWFQRHRKQKYLMSPSSNFTNVDVNLQKDMKDGQRQSESELFEEEYDFSSKSLELIPSEVQRRKISYANLSNFYHALINKCQQELQEIDEEPKHQSYQKLNSSNSNTLGFTLTQNFTLESHRFQEGKHQVLRMENPLASGILQDKNLDFLRQEWDSTF